MLDPYENILIGNFLYSTGLLLGSRSQGRELPVSINLLQQTPLDHLLGDVYLAYPGAIRIIEFKRVSNHSVKESGKLQHLQGALKGSPLLEQVSRTVHWYIVSDQGPLAWTTAVRPYLDLEKQGVAGVTLNTFIERMVAHALDADQPEFPPETIADYLAQVAKYAGTKGTSSSGLVVLLTKDGVLRHLQIDNVLDLRLQMRLLKERLNVRSKELDRENDHEIDPQTPYQRGKVQRIEIERERTRDRDRGHSLG